MTRLSIKRLIISYIALTFMIVAFVIGSDKCEIRGVEFFFYTLPAWVFAWCAQFFIVDERQ